MNCHFYHITDFWIKDFSTVCFRGKWYFLSPREKHNEDISLFSTSCNTTSMMNDHSWIYLNIWNSGLIWLEVATRWKLRWLQWPKGLLPWSLVWYIHFSINPFVPGGPKINLLFFDFLKLIAKKIRPFILPHFTR